MINPVSIVAIAFLVTLLALMYFAWVSEGYTAPNSLVHAITRNLKPLFAFSGGAAVANLALHGLAFRNWEAGFFIGLAIAVGVWFSVDLFFLNRRAKTNTE